MGRNRMIYKEGQRCKGRKDFIDHCNEKRLTATKAIYAYCYECSNGIAEEIKNCLVKDCPLYNHNPYNRKPKKHFKLNSDALEKARQQRKVG